MHLRAALQQRLHKSLILGDDPFPWVELEDRFYHAVVGIGEEAVRRDADLIHRQRLAGKPRLLRSVAQVGECHAILDIVHAGEVHALALQEGKE